MIDLLEENSIILDCSTLSPNFCIETQKKALEKNIQYIDCPVSGGVKGAENKTLTFMVGSE